MNLKFLLPTSLFGGASAALGAIIHAVVGDGGASLTQFGFGGGLIATALVVVTRMYSAWKAAGGKFDGRLTEAESRALIGGAAAELKLSPKIQSAAEHFAPQVAALGTRAIAAVQRSIPGATELLSLMSNYLDHHTETRDSNHNAVLWQCVDVLSRAIEGNPAGEDLIAKFRDQLDLKLFPGTSQPAAA